MTQVYVPDIGSIIECAEDWSFALYNEHRNYSMAEACALRETGKSRWGWNETNYGKPYGIVTLPKGTKLRVDRVYVRQGLSSFSSLTFVIQSSDDPRFCTVGPKGGKKMKKIRFWAKLADINAGNWNLISDPSTDPEKV